MRNVLNRLTGLTITAAATVAVGLIGLTGPAAATDDPYPPKGGWPTPTCGGRWHPCTTSPPRHTTPPPVETPPPPAETTLPPPVTTTQPPPPPAETTTPPAETVTRTRTVTETTPAPPVWTKPNLPVTGARPAVVVGAAGGGLALIAAGIALWVWARRRRDLPHTETA